MATPLGVGVRLPSFGRTVYPIPFDEYETNDLATPSFGGFNPSTNNYEFTSEGDTFKEYFKNKTGRNLNILPVNPEVLKEKPELAGYFDFRTKVGGSIDPVNRNIYMTSKEENNPFIIAHEAGHAADPQINVSFNPSKVYSETPVNNPAAFLNSYIQGNPNAQKTFLSELEAQRAAVEDLKKLEIPTGAFQGDPWFKGYPVSFIEKGIENATDILTASNYPDALLPSAYEEYARTGRVPTMMFPNANQIFDNTEKRARAKMNLNLNPVFNNAVQDILENARRRADRTLGGI